MSRAIRSIIQLWPAALVSLSFLVGCQHILDEPLAPPAPPVPRIEVVRPERHTVRRSVGEPGELQSIETTAIHAKIPGYVKTWTVNIGAVVKKGQLLVELAVPEIVAQVEQKRAAVEHAEAKLAQSNASVKMAAANIAGAEAKLTEVRAGVKRAAADLSRWQAEFERVERLFHARAQTGSLVDETRSKLESSQSARAEIDAQVKTAEVGMTQARAAFDQAQSDVGVAAAGVDVAREDVRRAEAELSYARIVAPFDGIVTERNVDTGALTQPGAGQAPLFVVARSDIMIIRVHIPEAYAANVNPGDRAQVKLQELNGKIVHGTVARVSWALDPKTRTIRAEIDVPNPGGTLLPGLYGYATVIVEEHADVLTVPLTAVVKEGEQSFCVAVVEGRAVRRPIRLGLTDGLRAEVISGLEATEWVVRANAASLTAGQPVQLAEPAAAAPASPAAKP